MESDQLYCRFHLSCGWRDVVGVTWLALRGQRDGPDGDDGHVYYGKANAGHAIVLLCI